MVISASVLDIMLIDNSKLLSIIGLEGKNLFAKKIFNWNSVFKKDIDYWNEAKLEARHGSRTLIATSLGGYNQGAILESVLAVALTLRGASVEVLLCDQLLPACQMTKIGKISPEKLTKEGQKDICRNCLDDGLEVYKPLGLKVHLFSQFVNREQRKYAKKIANSLPFDKIENFKYRGLLVGEHAFAGALRYYARGDLDGEELGEKILRLYFEASLLSVFAIEGILEKNKYDVVCFHHGIYVPQGLIGEVCRKRGVRVVNWNPAYRKHTFIFSHGDSYHHTMLSESTNGWENIIWNDALERKTMNYLKSRWKGSQDWIWFLGDKPIEEKDKIEKEIGVDFRKPTIGMLSSVMWDAKLHYQSNAFADMLEWTIETIKYFSRRKDLQLAIRIHPAEITGLVPSRQPLLSEIKKVFRELPENVVVIPPESKISTYVVMDKCDSVIIYNTKTGIELASLGIPVIVAGEAWIRNKGFTIDVSSPKEYFKILDKLPLKKRLSEEKTTRALKYAFHFFFRRMIPLPFIESPEKFRFKVNIKRLDELLSGHYPGLDVICNGILSGKPFIYKAETFHE